MSLFSLFSSKSASKINKDSEVYRLAKSVDGDENIAVVGRGAVVRTITSEDRQRFNKIAQQYADKYLAKK